MLTGGYGTGIATPPASNLTIYLIQLLEAFMNPKINEMIRLSSCLCGGLGFQFSQDLVGRTKVISQEMAFRLLSKILNLLFVVPSSSAQALHTKDQRKSQLPFT